MEKYFFREAVPVWESGKESEINYNLCFRAVIGSYSQCVVALSASNMYQMFVNGRLAAEGPARAGHGYSRTDEIDIAEYLDRDKENIVCIYVDGYNVPNYYLINMPAFLCAEIIADGEIVAATGKHGFYAKYHDERVREVIRYSFQRTFTEIYNCDNGYRGFETDVDYDFCAVGLKKTEPKEFICRDVPYPDYGEVHAKEIIGLGSVEQAETLEDPMRDRVLMPADRKSGFSLDEIEKVSCDEAEKCLCHAYDDFKPTIDCENFELKGNEYALYALPSETTGFINLEVECSEDTTLIAMFDETLMDGDVDLRRTYGGNTTINVVIWNLKKGKYSLITNEPYSFKYIKIINNGDTAMLRVGKLYVNRFVNGVKLEPLGSDDEKLNMVYDAAFETFRQNAVDIYTDCPSRERAGWLCDSFFIARVERELTGASAIEKNFLENFIVNKSERWKSTPMLPRCYPADFDEGGYIPQWAMWFILELEEYIKRTDDREMFELARETVVGLMKYFEGYENEDGLLEKLDGWLFVEWSKANAFVRDVNYPTNMLYSRTLRAVYSLYGGDYLEKAEKIKKKICEQSFFNGFFHDHAVRDENGVLRVADDITETCQYYAFFTEIADIKTHGELWNILLNDFGADRQKRKLWENIYPSNAFIGYFLRLEILARANERDRLLGDIKEYFYPMAVKTGTLWELNKQSASCNHGFASHVILWLRKFCVG